MTIRQYTAIPQVIDGFGEILEVDAIARDAATCRILDPRFYQCGQCGQPVHYRSGGSTRRDHFAHLRATDDTPDCIWRTDRKNAFAERNRHGDDGSWHIQAALEIMGILEQNGLAAVRNASVSYEGQGRKPDILTTIDGQKVRFEIQASPTDMESARQRSERDLRAGAITLWVVNTERVNPDQALSAWLDNLHMLGGGQLWCWDEDCLAASIRARTLVVKRLRSEGGVQEVDLRDELPRNVQYCAKTRPSGLTRIDLYSASEWRSGRQVHENEELLRHGLASDGRRSISANSYPVDYKQGNILLNVPNIAWAPIGSGPQAREINRRRRELATIRSLLTVDAS